MKCRPYGAYSSLFFFTHPSRGGLSNAALRALSVVTLREQTVIARILQTISVFKALTFHYIPSCFPSWPLWLVGYLLIANCCFNTSNVCWAQRLQLNWVARACPFSDSSLFNCSSSKVFSRQFDISSTDFGSKYLRVPPEISGRQELLAAIV